VVVAGSDLEAAVQAFDAAGFESRLADALEEAPAGGPRMVALTGDAAAALRDADVRGIRYLLVHVGPDDGQPEGSYARAHHRVAAAELPELARRVRPRERMLLTCLSFGYKAGLPPEADWVVDARFLDNPYWVEELRPLDGRHSSVSGYVLGQPGAVLLLDRLAATLEALVPLYERAGRSELVLAFGCTGGRHRSVALAADMARRLSALPGVEVEVRDRELER
jgi:hypothetical protein